MFTFFFLLLILYITWPSSGSYIDVPGDNEPKKEWWE